MLIIILPYLPLLHLPQVEKLASGLGHERSLSVVALNGDTPASRYFARDVLGLQYMPSFVLFPRHSRCAHVGGSTGESMTAGQEVPCRAVPCSVLRQHARADTCCQAHAPHAHTCLHPCVATRAAITHHRRTFYKYKGKARDAKSLLKFMNMVCNQSEDRVWQLGAAGAAEAVAAAAAAESSTVVAAVAPPAAAAAAASGSKLAQGGPGLGVVGSAVLGVAALALAGKVLLGGGGRKAGPEGDLVAEVDSSISRMAGLMVKLLGARVGLSVGKLAQAAGGASASSSPARTTTTIDVVSSSSSSNGNGNGAASSNGAGTKTAPAAAQPATKAAAAAGVTVGAARATVAAATFALPAVSDAAQGFSGSSSGSSLTADAAQLLEAVQGWQPLQQQQQPGYELGVVDVLVQEEEEERFARAPSPEEALEHLGVGHLPGQMLEAGLTGEAVRVTRRLDADEVLRLLEQEGADVNKVLDRLGSEGLLAVEQVDRR